MKRFEYRLSPLLRLRESLRDERRQHLADAYRVESSLNEQMQDLLDEQRRARQGHTPAVGVVDVDWLIEGQRYSAVLELNRRDLQQQLTAVAAEIETRRQSLVEADQQVRVLERLRDVQKDRWKYATEREETKQFDEIAAQRYAQEAR